jgi:phage gpG-like protein
MARGSIWDQIMRHARAHSRAGRESHVKVGILGSRGGKQTTDGGITVIELAAIHEFGAPRAHIPERSFIRRTMTQREQDIVRKAAGLARAYITGKISMEQALNMLGAWAAAQIKNTITADEHIPPPLKPRTIERKGSDRPLVDTGQLVNSITWKVWIGRIRDSRGRFVKGGT